MDRISKDTVIRRDLRGQVCELELVTPRSMPDGTVQEVVHTRRAVCKGAVRRANSTVYRFADVDRDALEKVFPFEVFTTRDFPEIFAEHVGRRITQGVGTVVKVPLTWITKSGGTWKYAGPKVIGTAGTILTVYRGHQPAQGAVVAASEYTTGTATGAATGVQVLTVNFVREQLDEHGRPYLIEADISLPGSRVPADELARILALYGISTDAASFAAAATYDAGAGFLIDALYNGRTGTAIVEDLCAAARAWLSQSATNAWVLVQDSPKAAALTLNTAADEVEIEEHGDPEETPKSIALYYRPKVSGAEDYAPPLTRSITSGIAGDKEFKNQYIRDHVVADKWLSYQQKRLGLKVGSGTIHAVQLANGARITITDDGNHWQGAKDVLLTGISRPADRNRIRLRDYDEAIYTYSAGDLPTDATNGYAPDLTFTPPAAPTNLTVVSQGQSADNDGKVTAHAKIRATPPASNWSRLMIRVEDTTTGEEYTQQLFLVGGNYETIIAGLRPNRAHRVLAWAVNANNLDGTVTAWTNFTSANATNALSAPTVTVTQVQSREVKVELSAVADVAGQPKFRRNVLFEKVGAGSYTEVKRSEERTFIRTVNHGTQYDYKARSEDIVGNESADSSSAGIIPTTRIDDTYIIGQGVSGQSIANSSINRARNYTGTTTYTGTLNNGFRTSFGFGLHAFVPSLTAAANMKLECYAPEQSDDQGYITFNNDSGGNQTYTVIFRNFNA